MRRANYEVRIESVTLVNSGGHTHHFSAGSDLPDWVTPDQIKSLLDNRAIQEFEVLGNGR